MSETHRQHRTIRNTLNERYPTRGNGSFSEDALQLGVACDVDGEPEGSLEIDP